MKHFFTSISKYAKAHKFAAFLVVVVVLGGGYYVYGKVTATPTETRYVLASASRETIVSSVSGTGQVSAMDQRDVKPKVSGDVVYVGVKNGDIVKAGTLLVKLDTTDAEHAVNDAQTSLDQANLDLQKMQGLTTDAGIIRSDKAKAEDDLANAYDDGFNTVSNAFLDFPDIMAGLQDTLFGTSLANGQWNLDYYVNAIQNISATYPYDAYKFRNDASAAYAAARTAYDANFSDYKLTSRFSDTGTIEKLIDETYSTTQLISEAVKSSNNLIQLYKDRLTAANTKTLPAADTYLSQLSTYTSKINTYLSSLLSARTTIQDDKEVIVNVGFNVTDQKIKVTQAENALADAKESLAEHYVYAPLAGTVAEVNVKKGDSVSSGSAVTTMITTQQVTDITLNEVDVAKVKVGQKATMTFDAFPGLTLTGKVTQVDSIGAVSQGVVNYGVQIAFDNSNQGIKPGMSVSASIVTDVKDNALAVPNAAVKTGNNGSYYVETLADADKSAVQSAGSQGIASAVLPGQKAVEIGVANDTVTEITSGLNEGDWVVTRTITAAQQAASTQSQSSSAFGGIRIPGAGR